MPENKFLKAWQKIYDSKVGQKIRDFMLGSQEVTPLGLPKYRGGIGAVGLLVAPEWEGLEVPEVTAMHYGVKAAPKAISAVETERFMEVPQKIIKVKPLVQQKEPYSKAMKSAFKERTGYDFDGIPEVMKQRELKSWQDYVTRLRQEHKRTNK